MAPKNRHRRNLTIMEASSTESDHHGGGECINGIRAFIKLAHLVEDSEKNLISLFLAGVMEELRRRVKMDKPLNMVATYRSACAREMIAITDKRFGKIQSYKTVNNSMGHYQPAGKPNHTIVMEKGNNSTSPAYFKRPTQAQI